MKDHFGIFRAEVETIPATMRGPYRKGDAVTRARGIDILTKDGRILCSVPCPAGDAVWQHEQRANAHAVADFVLRQLNRPLP